MSKTAKRATSNRLSGLGLTIYPGYALVQGSYPVRLDEGSNRFQVDGLPTNYDPSSLYFDSFRGPGDITLGASSYRAANLSPIAMLQRSINKRVTVRYGGTLESEQHEVKGTLVGFTGNVALLKIAGQGVREIRNVVGYTFGDVPEGLSNTPSLSVAVEATAKGDYVANILYKALGLNWSADYKWIYDEKAGKITWDGSVFISNSSGASFPDAQLKVVAGDVGAESDGYANDAPMMAMSAGLESAGGGRSSRKVRQATNESLGQVKVFTIPARGTIEEGESQKIPFFAANDVPVARENRIRAQHNWHARGGRRVDVPVHTILIFTNSADNKLGSPLPGGSVSVMQRDSSGSLLKSGGGTMGDVAVGEECKLHTGTDFDLKASRIVTDIQTTEALEKLPKVEGTEPATDSKKKAKPRKVITTTLSCAVEVFNGKDQPVVFVIEEVTSGDELKFDGKVHGFTPAEEANKFEQKLTVPAGEKATLSYKLIATSFEDRS